MNYYGVQYIEDFAHHAAVQGSDDAGGVEVLYFDSRRQILPLNSEAHPNVRPVVGHAVPLVAVDDSNQRQRRAYQTIGDHPNIMQPLLLRSSHSSFAPQPTDLLHQQQSSPLLSASSFSPYAGGSFIPEDHRDFMTSERFQYDDDENAPGGIVAAGDVMPGASMQAAAGSSSNITVRSAPTAHEGDHHATGGAVYFDEVILANDVIVLPRADFNLWEGASEQMHGAPDDGALTKNPLLIRSIVKQLLDALEHIHRRGYAHGDVKTANVVCDEVLAEDGSVVFLHVRFIDFGDAVHDTEVGDVWPRGTSGYVPAGYNCRNVHPKHLDCYGLFAMIVELIFPSFQAAVHAHHRFIARCRSSGKPVVHRDIARRIVKKFQKLTMNISARIPITDALSAVLEHTDFTSDEGAQEFFRLVRSWIHEDGSLLTQNGVEEHSPLTAVAESDYEDEYCYES